MESDFLQWSGRIGENDMTLLERSIYGSVLILVTLLVRACLLKKLPKRTFLVLWGLAIFRLLSPYAPYSKYSVYSLINLWFGSWSVEAKTRMTQAQEKISVGSLHYIWIGGLAVCVLAFAVSYIRCMREFHTSLPVEEEWVDDWARWHRTRRELSVRQSDRIKSPLTYGVIHPVILLPKSFLTAEQGRLKCVLEHEYIHIRTFDALFKLLLVVTACMHWYNPFIWLMLVYCNRDMELACDEKVLKEPEEAERAEYARMLIGLEAERSGYALSLGGYGKKTMEARIQFIMKYQRASKAAVMGSVLVVLLVAVVFATVGDKADSLYWSMRMTDEENMRELHTWLGQDSGAHSLAYEFWDAYVAGDMEAMRKMLPENYDGPLEVFPTDDSRFDAANAKCIGSQIQIPHGYTLKAGDIVPGRIEFKTGVEGVPYWDLWLEFRKTEDDWEIFSFLGLQEWKEGSKKWEGN